MTIQTRVVQRLLTLSSVTEPTSTEPENLSVRSLQSNSLYNNDDDSENSISYLL